MSIKSNLKLVIDGDFIINKKLWAKKLLNKYKEYNITFSDISENKPHKLKEFKSYINICKSKNNLILGGLIAKYSEVLYYYSCGLITDKEYKAILKQFKKYQYITNSYIHIYLTTNPNIISEQYEKFKKIPNPFKEAYIKKTTLKLYKEHNINFLIIDVSQEQDVDLIIKLIKKYI